VPATAADWPIKDSSGCGPPKLPVVVKLYGIWSASREPEASNTSISKVAREVTKSLPILECLLRCASDLARGTPNSITNGIKYLVFEAISGRPLNARINSNN
jgi:hypothetical protein